jgi:hypothetical protein
VGVRVGIDTNENEGGRVRYVAKHRSTAEPIKHGLLRYRGEHESLSYDDGPRRCSTCNEQIPYHDYSEHEVGFRGAT